LKAASRRDRRSPERAILLAVAAIAAQSPLARGRLQRRRQPLRIIGADAASFVRSQAQFDRIEAGDVVEPEARRHPDAETVPPMVTHGRNRLDFIQRQPIAPKSRAEMPPQFPFAW
jgi:hypothetical protein